MLLLSGIVNPLRVSIKGGFAARGNRIKQITLSISGVVSMQEDSNRRAQGGSVMSAIVAKER
jgi:hypothetical protein